MAIFVSSFHLIPPEPKMYEYVGIQIKWILILVYGDTHYRIVLLRGH